jgi:iron complex outermembrane receptor protein
MGSLRRQLALLILMLLGAPSAHADSADDDDSAVDDSADRADDDDSADAPPPQTEPATTSPPTASVRDAVVVTAQRPTRTDTHARVEIEETALERTRGQDLAEALSQVPGVTIARGTADTSKPVIRGQQERRLLVLFDGVRHESQKWGADHATEIDPFAAGSLSVIKGAAGVRYGPDAIGGVVLVAPPPLLTTPGVDGVVQIVGVSNGLRLTGAGRLDLAPAALPGFVARVEGNYSRGSSLRTPTYVLGNTASQQWNAGTTLHYHRRGVHLTVSYSHYDLRSGVFYGIASSTPDDFEASLGRETPLGADTWTQSPRIERPYQTVAHDRVLARAELFFPRVGSLTVSYAFQHNRRREFEQVRSAVEGPQYDFTLRTHSLDLAFDHESAYLPGGSSLRGGLGVSSSFQENVFAGVPLVPNHRALGIGVFGVERLTGERFAVEIGGRYDHLGRASFLSDSAFARHLARGTLSDGDCTASGTATRCGLAFDTASLSAGLLVRVVPDVVDLKVDLSSASRFPNGDELYMNGSAPTLPVYALGDPDLGPETTWGVSPTVGLRLPWLEAELSAHFSYIDDYINFAPELGEDGRPAFDVTVRGAYPRFAYHAVDSLFYGLDGGVTVGTSWPVQVSVGGSLVRGDALDTGRPLLFIPADRLSFGVRGKPPHVGPLHDGFVELSGEYVFRQRHTDEAADLSPAPDGVLRLGAGAGARSHVAGGNTLEVGLEGNNILNRRYRDYSSLLRYYADEPGVEVRLRVRFEFHQHPQRRPLDAPNDQDDPDHHPDEPGPVGDSV